MAPRKREKEYKMVGSFPANSSKAANVHLPPKKLVDKRSKAGTVAKQLSGEERFKNFSSLGPTIMHTFQAFVHPSQS